MRASPVAPAVAFIGQDLDPNLGHERERLIVLSKHALTPGANNAIERDSPVAV